MSYVSDTYHNTSPSAATATAENGGWTTHHSANSYTMSSVVRALARAPPSESGAHVGTAQQQALWTHASEGDVAALAGDIALASQDASLDLGCADSAGMTALMRAAQGGHVEAVKVLLSAGNGVTASINSRSNEGLSALHYACRAASLREDEGVAPRIDAVRALLAAGADPNLASTEELLTPLHIAAEANEDAIVELLLRAGADVNAACKWGKTPLLFAVSHAWDRVDVVRRLLAAGADVHARSASGATAIHACTTQANEALVDLLVSHGADVNCTGDQRDVDDPCAPGTRDGKRPLHYYIMHGGRHLPVAAALLRHGADPNALDSEGRTPLETMDYMRQKNRPLRDALTAAGARDWRTPLDSAIEAGDVDAVAAAIAENPAHVRVKRKADSPLVQAIRKRRADIVQVLLRGGATVTESGEGESVMADALNACDVDVVRVLLDEGKCSPNHAILDAGVGDGYTLLHWVCGMEIDCDVGDEDDDVCEGEDVCEDDASDGGGSEGEKETFVCEQERALVAIADLLIARGAKVDARDRNGSTPLQLACSGLSGALVRRLIAAGADSFAQSLHGETAFSVLAKMDDKLRRDVPDCERLFARMHVTSARMVHFGAQSIGHLDDEDEAGGDAGYDSDASDVCDLVRDWQYRAHNLPPGDMERLNPGLPVARAALLRAARGASLPLRDAIRARDANRVRELLRSGHSPSLPDTEGLRPLYHACHVGDADIIKALLDAGASPAQKCTPSLFPFCVAALHGHVEAVRALCAVSDVAELDNGASQPQAIHAAVVSGNVSVVDAVLAAGAHPDVPAQQETPTAPLWPLVLAAGLGNGAIVTRLLAAGASMNPTWGGGRNLLHFARAGAVDAVLCAGVDRNARDDQGRTALHLCARRGDDITASALLRAGLDVNARDAKGRTPLLYAQTASRSTSRRGQLRPGESFAAAAGSSRVLEFSRVAELLVAAGGTL